MSEPARSYSLRRRLLIWLLGPLSLIGALALADAYYSARQTANEVFDRVLVGSALAISERVFVNEHNKLDVDIPYVALEMLTSAANDRVFYRIEGPDQAFITGYKTLALPAPGQSTGQNPERMTFSDSHFRGTPIRIAVLSGVASTGNNSISYRVAVAETTNARDALTGQIIIRTAFRLALLILTAAIIVWFAVARSLIPLKRLEQAIGRRSSDDLRSIQHHVPKEVSGLVSTINGFMKRLDNALTALKHFSGNASHQIRTPLTIIKTQLALARRSGTREETLSALKICDDAVSEAERTLSQLLLLARIDEEASKSLTSAQAELTDIARNVTETYVIDAASSGLDLGFEGTGQVWCRGDPVLLRELLRNLIDNAIKHAQNGNQITVRVNADRDIAILQVEDDGIGTGQHRQITSGLMPKKQNGEVHKGVGLPIVFEIAKLFSGSVELKPGGGGKGLLVEVRLVLVNQLVA